MKSPRNHAQGRPEASHGSRESEVTMLPAFRGRVAHEAVHSHHLGIARNPKGPAAVARTRLGYAPGLVHFGRITYSPGYPSSLPAGGRSLSRRCAFGRQTGPGLPQGIVLPAIVDTRLQILAASPTSRRGSASKPRRTDPCFGEPSVQSHPKTLSSVDLRYESNRSERANGTVLYPSGEFPKTSGDQHEFG
jgi:hypothetical protein